MTKKNILIVDDDLIQCKIIGRFIENLGHNAIIMDNGLHVVDFFINKKVIDGVSCKDVDVMLLDLSMPDLDGLTILKQINALREDVQIIVLTANQDINSAINAINSGAVDYILKGESDIFARVTASINNAIDKRNLKYQISHLTRKNKDQVSFSDLVGQSEAINQVVKIAKKVSNSNVSILLEGEKGCGKELLACAIHGSSQRAGKPFVIVDCEMLKYVNGDEELFGSEKTNNDNSLRNIGKIREANNGTIYLNKIDALRLDLQTKLLRFMQQGEFLFGINKIPLRCNVRVIASTTKDLPELIKQKKFREDLYYRINTFSVRMPSLREMGEKDILLLAENFFRNFAVHENKKIKSISNEAIYLLQNYEWEDNIRQLKNAVFRAVVLCDGDIIKPEHFPNLMRKESNNLIKAKSIIKKNSDISSELFDVFDDRGTCKTLDSIEEEIIKRLVGMCNGNLSEVAKQLNIGRSTIYRKLKIAENV